MASAFIPRNEALPRSWRNPSRKPAMIPVTGFLSMTRTTSITIIRSGDAPATVTRCTSVTCRTKMTKAASIVRTA